MLRRVAAFCRPLRPVLPLVSLPRSRSPVVGVLGLCWLWRDVPFACQRRPVVGVLGLCWMWRDVPLARQRRPVVGVLGVVPPPPPLWHSELGRGDSAPGALGTPPQTFGGAFVAGGLWHRAREAVKGPREAVGLPRGRA